MLEGVAYGLRDSLELLRELGVEREVGRVSGGGTRCELWLRIVASVLGLPLERMAADEGAGVRRGAPRRRQAGVFPDAHEAVAALRPRPRPRRARSRWRAAYEAGYVRYRELYPALRTLQG